MASIVLAPSEAGAIPENECGIQGQNRVTWIQGSKMSIGFHYRNYILGMWCIVTWIQGSIMSIGFHYRNYILGMWCIKFDTINVLLWSNG